MNTWHINIEFTVAQPFSEETPFELMDALEEYAAAVSVSREFDAGGLTLTTTANDYEEATRTALNDSVKAITELMGNPTITSVKTQSEEAFQKELSEPLYPEVVSFAEIAKIAGVSRQRARQFPAISSFPKPVIQTSQGSLFNLHAVKKWVETRSTKAGRPAKAA